MANLRISLPYSIANDTANLKKNRRSQSFSKGMYVRGCIPFKKVIAHIFYAAQKTIDDKNEIAI